MADAADFTVTRARVDLVAALSLTVGVRYSIQNIDPGARVFVRVQQAMPTVGTRGNVIAPFEYGYPRVTANERIWIWTDDDGGAVVMVNEAP